MNTNQIVADHLAATVRLVMEGLDALRTQIGPDCHRDTLLQIARGAVIEVITRVSMAGARHIVLNLIATDGETINLGEVHIDNVDEGPQH